MKTTLVTNDGRSISYSSQLGRFEGPVEMPCLRCGVCCSKWQPLLDEEEVAAVAGGLGIPLDVFYRDHTERYPVKPNSYVFKRVSKACSYLKQEGGMAACSIHSFRPEACRNWTPHLSRRECQEGLKLRSAGGLLLPAQLGVAEEALCNWYQHLASGESDVLARASAREAR